MIKHIVCAKVENEEDRVFLIDLFNRMPEEMDFLHNFVAGRDVLFRKTSFDIGFVCDVDDWDALQRYIAHPFHNYVGDELRARRQGVAVLDLEF